MNSGSHAEQERPGIVRRFLSFVLMIAIVIGASWALRTYAIEPFKVPSGSMEDTIETGDMVFSEKLSYQFGSPKQGDIVVLRKESFMYEPIVKRVIAVEGQRVDIDFDKGVVYVDGEALEEPYIAEPTYAQLDFTGPITVPEGCVFVMGDNRNGSTDSRYSGLGCVDTRLIQGRVYVTVFPLKNFGWEAKHEGTFA